eukprot:CAMPEP_0171980084 /NCGR_PEP_ID=MMETSP0993-20121228/259757_1 /TAXON_ID=483369 /ORGANISM="non described non described, Strain CCMP2098" /LENGTH=393 /DNA_ID=CAMNT_0012632261 /DNA_START=51 /DNA_END=1232 /DNA_ORIENTATION=-
MRTSAIAASLFIAAATPSAHSILPAALWRRLPVFLGGPRWYAKEPQIKTLQQEEDDELGAGLGFECTGCGKCCTMDGDVWLAPEESEAIARHLNMPSVEAFEALYARQAVESLRGDRWLCLVRSGGSESGPLAMERDGREPEGEDRGRSTDDLPGPTEFSAQSSSSPTLPSPTAQTFTPAPASHAPDDGAVSPSPAILPSSMAGCVFLDPLGKCSIYEVRPLQCRTYPFWPSLLEDAEAWSAEAVLPDNVPLPLSSHTAVKRDGDQAERSDEESAVGVSAGKRSDVAGAGVPRRHWSMSEGGCEGIVLGAEDASYRAQFSPPPNEEIDLPGGTVVEVGGALAPGGAQATMVPPNKNSTAAFVPHDAVTALRASVKRHWRRFPDAEIKETTWYL